MLVNACKMHVNAYKVLMKCLWNACEMRVNARKMLADACKMLINACEMLVNVCKMLGTRPAQVPADGFHSGWIS